MKINRKIIIILILVLILIFVNYFYLNNKKDIKYESPQFIENVKNEVLLQDNRGDILVDVSNKDLNKKEIVVKDDIYNLNYKLEILGQVYNSSFKEGETLEIVMLRLDKEKEDFNFKTSKHLSLGSFVEELNSIRGGGGKYWIYYINDKEAEVGISKYLLKDGDIISWKLE